MTYEDRFEHAMKRPIRTSTKWFFIVLAVFIVLAIIFSVIGYANNWGRKAAEVLGPDNVQAQFAVVIENWEALTVTSDNACLVGSGKAGDSNSPLLVESPVLAYAATYRNVRAEYNAAFADIFKAGVVGPPGYPREIPNYEEAIGATPDFCTVSASLAELKANL